ncbi:hypothetical protein EJB05_35767, partial [Eragrostis curvula]
MEMTRDAWRRLIYSLLLGQLAAFVKAVISFTTSLISNLGADAPLTQSFVSYLLLALVYGTFFLYRQQKLCIPWYWYLSLAFIDVQGGFLVIKAYNYSYITSINLLDCWTILWVMILTRFALGTRYSFWQFVGAGTCMAGLALVLLSDSNSPDLQDASKRALLGDALIIAATFCFAFSDVGQEYCVKKKDRIEFIAMLGIFGVKLLKPVLVYSHMALPLSFSIVAMSGATMLNLSLLTSDIWAVIIRIFFYHQQVNWLYYIAFAVVAVGLTIYSMNETAYDGNAASATETATRYEQLASEEMGGAHPDWQERKEQEDHNALQAVDDV